MGIEGFGDSVPWIPDSVYDPFCILK